MTQKEEHLIKAILDSPSAPALVARLIAALEVEKKRRLQFYEDIDDDMKVEFINGEIVVHSPVKKAHLDVTIHLCQILRPFVQINKLGYVGFEKAMSSFSRNDYEPDIVYFKAEKAAFFTKEQWKFPVPDFVVEVLSESTEARDRGIKFEDYAAHGVEEYWIIDPDDASVEQYFLVDNHYKLHLKSDHGAIESKVIQGFSIDIRAIFDENANMEALRKLMAG
ncbi:MAG: Uma2 family endonuclease [Bacteroidota bacterium]